jgi:hypothetical protein
MEKDLSDWWKEVREDVANYLAARGNLTRIQAYEKVGKVTGVLVSFLILAFISGFVIVFLLIMVGSWIAALTDSIVLGYSSVAMLVLSLFIFLAVKRKSVLEKPVTEKVIDALYEEEDFIDQDQNRNSNDQESEKV